MELPYSAFVCPSSPLFLNNEQAGDTVEESQCRLFDTIGIFGFVHVIVILKPNETIKKSILRFYPPNGEIPHAIVRHMEKLV